ncbi:MAG: hypothetical protein IKB84_02070 [Clostridia bacterium]|nr:hypothetical protein [Clostridia bacterium]
MKNRRNIVIAFMLCAVMLLGVGYAAVSDALDINGTAEINAGNVQSAFDANVYFSGAVANNHTTGNNPDKAWISAEDNDVADFGSYNLSKVGDFSTFTFTIKNASDLKVSVMPVLTYSGSTEAQALSAEYFDVYSDWKVGDTVQPREIAAGGEITYTVTVKLKKTPALAAGGLLSSSFNIKLTATTVESMANN